MHTQYKRRYMKLLESSRRHSLFLSTKELNLLKFYEGRGRKKRTSENIMEVSSRDPYPFPTLQNDDNFMGTNSLQKQPYTQPTHLAQQKDPWKRLNTTSTLASARREVFHYDPKAPRDSLDFVLKADYDHHGAFLRSKNETLVQPETIGENHGRVLKNRKKEEPSLIDPMNPPTIETEIHEPKKESIHSVKGAIDSHHSAATNAGYSRKHDGGFYTT